MDRHIYAKLRRLLRRNTIFVVLSIPVFFFLLIIGVIIGSVLTVTVGSVGGVASLVASAVVVAEKLMGVLHENTNSQVTGVIEESDDLSYQPLVEILDKAGVSFSEMLEKYAGDREVVLVSLDEGDAESPAAVARTGGDTDATRTVDGGTRTSRGRGVRWTSQHEDAETAYLDSSPEAFPDANLDTGATHSAFREGVEARRLSDEVWVIPPRSVPEPVARGEDSAVGTIVQDPDDVVFAAVVDLSRFLPRNDNRIVELLADFVGRDTYERAMSDHRIDLLEHVRDANLTFFLPEGSLTEQTEREILRNQDVVLHDVEPPTVRGLADENNFEEIVDGLKRVDVTVGQPETVARQIVNRAEMWLERLEEL